MPLPICNQQHTEMMSRILAPAQLENLEELVEFVSHCAREKGFEQKRVSEIEIAAEEAFVNIINYAYRHMGSAGDIEVQCGFEDSERFIIEITDSGIPFNVLNVAEPDISSDVSHRKIGGLGIFFMKKLMDEVCYKYIEGKNVLTLVVNKA
ncbi:MAG: ATP-binding protein [Syntrophus sp. (in: bacteria)]|nr:ATP-binding protein [Syntrophus sp. (in: bacteria)]